MNCPTLNELPPPPSNQTGWPWIEEISQLSICMPKGEDWPKISVITPSYNQGQFIEETIRSVLLQGYPNLEYIIIDGGSTDNTLDIIRKYEPWLTYWVSEPDKGQAHAINKGFTRATGELLGWINSDDCLLPHALTHLAIAFSQNPKLILLGDIINIKEQTGSRQLARQHNVTFDTILEHWRHDIHWQQPGTYFPRSLFQEVGLFDESLRYVFDWDWMCQALQTAEVFYIGIPVAFFRFHSQSKTVAEAAYWHQEECLVLRRYQHKLKSFDERVVWANFEVHTAKSYLRLQNLQRKVGLAHLWAALNYNWQVIYSRRFLILLVRALTPALLLKLARAFHHFWQRKALYNHSCNVNENRSPQQS